MRSHTNARSNFCYWTLIANVWMGECSLQSLFGCKAHPSAWRINNKTGKLEVKYYTQTLATRLNMLWGYVLATRQEFLNRPTDGFLPPRTFNWVHIIYCYGEQKLSNV